MKIATLSLVSVLILLSPPDVVGQWVRQDLPPDIRMVLSIGVTGDSSAAASGYIIAGDFHGRAVYTVDGGTTWNSAAVPDSSRSLVTMTFVSQTAGFIAAAYNKSTLSRNTDGGTRHRSLPVGAASIRSLERAGFSAGSFTGGMLLSTTDGGHSWSVNTVFPDSVVYLLGASFLGPWVGYITADFHPFIGDPGILKTTDGGASWTTLPLPDSITTLRNVFFITEQYGYAVGSQFRGGMISGVIIRTTDGGSTWQRQDFPNVTDLLDVDFPTISTGYAVGSKANSFVYKTTDGGLTWAPLSYQPDTVVLEGICFAPGTVAGTVYGMKIQNDSLGFPLPPVPVAVTTTDGGNTWTESYAGTGLSGKILVGGVQTDALRAYLGGGDGTVEGMMLHTDNGGVTAISPGNHVLPDRVRLGQNYPNPFNPSTTIRFDLPRESRLTISAFNLLGQQVALIASGTFPPGVHAVAWNAAGFPAGVYYYRLAGDGFTEMKKLVLLK
ncbi:MAG TPA: T9SS type A sorting domain-containing protein [Bacteroidota bacterium]|nr:T9SS type A sorting domain-containing protein [Bacteroidota bacterium]